ncbi:hypothetical protein VOLCADRAFT_118225, partial [Volvox carteri f. nagariensis]
MTSFHMQATIFTRAASLASAALRLSHTLSEGAAEGMLNMCQNIYELLRPAVRQRTEPYPEDLTGKVAIVTGGNAGIGFATAQQLARRGAHVVLACRDKARAEAAVQAIAHWTPALPGCGPKATATASASADHSPTGIRVESMDLDLGRLSSVRSFAEEWRRRGLPLHLLVCNAGVMAPLEKTLTSDGLEVQFQVNFLSHWLLTHLLLDHERERRREQQHATTLMAAATAAAAAAAAAGKTPKAAAAAGEAGKPCTSNCSGGGACGDAILDRKDGSCNPAAGAVRTPQSASSTRVVIVSSVVHRAGVLQWSDLLSQRSYEPYITYGLSKLATVIFAKELQRRLDRHPEYGLYDTAVAIHPGIVRTNLANGFFRTYTLSSVAGTPLEPLRGLWQRAWDKAGQVLLTSPAQAAERMLAACLAPPDQVAGKYLALGRVYSADA